MLFFACLTWKIDANKKLKKLHQEDMEVLMYIWLSED